MKYLLVFAYLCFFSCSSSKLNEINKIYTDRNEIIKLYTSKSVIRSRGEGTILFYTYNAGKTNRYFFNVTNEGYQLNKDSIEYEPDILQIKNAKGSEAYKQELIDNMAPLVEKMDKLHIRDIKADLADAGILLKIYIKESEAVMVYASNPLKDTSLYWQSQINSMQQLDKNWFYTFKEK